MDAQEIRKHRLRILVTHDGGPAAFAKRSQPDADKPIDPSYVSQILNGHRTFGEKAAVSMAKRAGLAEGFFSKDVPAYLWEDVEVLAYLLNVGVSDLAHDHGLGQRADTGNPVPVEKSHLSNVSPAPDIAGRVPLISWVQAGMWNEAVDIYEPGYVEEWLPVLKKNGHQTYALRVEGDSMTAPYGRSYPEGCCIIVDPEQRSPVSGSRVIAKLAGSSAVTFKVYVEEAGRRWLKPLNPQHPPIFDEFRILGTVTGTYIPE